MSDLETFLNTNNNFNNYEITDNNYDKFNNIKLLKININNTNKPLVIIPILHLFLMMLADMNYTMISLVIFKI
jgi:hypothetical protein